MNVAYSYAEENIKTGDIIFFTQSKNYLVKAFKQFVRSDQYHVGIAIHLNFNGEDKLFLVESIPSGRRMTKLAAYRDVPLVVLRHSSFPLDSRYVAQYYFDDLLDNIGFMDYSLLGFLSMLIYEKLGIKLQGYKGETCAEMVAHVLKLEETLLTPGVLYKKLLARGFEVVMEVN